VPATTMYYMYNAHGDVTALIYEDGTIAATYEYDAFGNITGQTGSADNNITYAGYQYDWETGLYYLNARYYDARIARFLTEDTYRGSINDPLSLNLYTYCYNNPIRYWDPTGNIVTEWDRKHCTPEEILLIEQATKDWEAANASGDKAGMQAAH